MNRVQDFLDYLKYKAFYKEDKTLKNPKLINVMRGYLEQMNIVELVEFVHDFIHLGEVEEDGYICWPIYKHFGPLVFVVNSADLVDTDYRTYVLADGEMAEIDPDQEGRNVVFYIKDKDLLLYAYSKDWPDLGGITKFYITKVE